jgi:hypothetical protein
MVAYRETGFNFEVPDFFRRFFIGCGAGSSVEFVFSSIVIRLSPISVASRLPPPLCLRHKTRHVFVYN